MKKQKFDKIRKRTKVKVLNGKFSGCFGSVVKSYVFYNQVIVKIFKGKKTHLRYLSYEDVKVSYEPWWL